MLFFNGVSHIKKAHSVDFIATLKSTIWSINRIPAEMKIFKVMVVPFLLFLKYSFQHLKKTIVQFRKLWEMRLMIYKMRFFIDLNFYQICKNAYQ